ncbi:bifunctional adenosylcobinamide kinase/adenosylcobinamide-phosphate guanylyltransferase [Cohaesibacter celericrescens]|uniref:Bifunctional adenosylcobalamin biosynthesis protein n=1 Tax=Cohaesibacter celericrescens TaxID=2067669 RepID=A0A2N5XT45_9HYPH|nr:bifunctional adenosylcobinamide kinase/adenosylcobinamide-phosphate guanylyltransferase [Cohaesibacter celericrescens]PLW77674.1 bifunctional adenosylcobinamide kinase/adenosylcobinamide-phosphate guanylyltransferase [Cohaesibacter celericrescens]
MSIQPPNTTLIIGGARSGKSSFAESLCEQSVSNLIYIATSPRFDDDAEMVDRIEQHRARRGPRWHAIEEQIALTDIIQRHDAPDNAILIDCMTLWLNNLLYRKLPLDQQFAALVAALKGTTAKIVLISNEVGQGVVPSTSEGRHFRDHQGRLNQTLASCCDRVIEVKAGLPLQLKPINQPPIKL